MANPPVAIKCVKIKQEKIKYCYNIKMASQGLVESIVIPLGVAGFLYFIYAKNTSPQTGGSHTRSHRSKHNKTRKH